MSLLSLFPPRGIPLSLKCIPSHICFSSLSCFLSLFCAYLTPCAFCLSCAFAFSSLSLLYGFSVLSDTIFPSLALSLLLALCHWLVLSLHLSLLSLFIPSYPTVARLPLTALLSSYALSRSLSLCLLSVACSASRLHGCSQARMCIAFPTHAWPLSLPCTFPLLCTVLLCPTCFAAAMLAFFFFFTLHSYSLLLSCLT